MESITVFAPGSPVKILRSEFDPLTGHVVMVEMSCGGYIRYNVAWWEDEMRITEWLEAFEVDATEDSVEQVISLRERA